MVRIGSIKECISCYLNAIVVGVIKNVAFVYAEIFKGRFVNSLLKIRMEAENWAFPSGILLSSSKTGDTLERVCSFYVRFRVTKKKLMNSIETYDLASQFQPKALLTFHLR
jgi:hypothetical protein